MAESGWTLDTLRSHLVALLDAAERKNEVRFAAIEQATSIAITSAQRAVEKAEAAVEKRLEGMNEFRSSLADQSKLQIPRTEAEARFADLDKQIAALTSRIDRSEGRGSGLSAGWAWLAGVIALILAAWAALN